MIFYSALRDYRHVFSGCVSHLVSPTQSSVHKVAVLGFGEEQDEEKVFVALPEKGMFVIIYFTYCVISLKIMRKMHAQALGVIRTIRITY